MVDYEYSAPTNDASGQGSALAAVSEGVRQSWVESYGLAGPEAWDEVDPKLYRLANQAQQLTGADFAAINVFDDHRQWSVMSDGRVTLSPREISLCQQVLARTNSTEIVLLVDAGNDPEVKNNPWVNGDAGAICSYAAMPLTGRDGCILGTLCVWSEHPRTFSEEEQVSLRVIRNKVMRHLNTALAKDEADQSRAGRRPAADQPAAGPEWSIHQVIAEQNTTTVFQPVVHLASRSVVGFEALSRGPAGSSLESPTALIEAAQDAGVLAELDWLCRARAMSAAAESRLPAELSWLVNVELASLTSDCPEELEPALAEASKNLRVVLEVVERGIEGRVIDLLVATDRARLGSYGVALDDIGSDERCLALITLLQPDIVKLDASLLQGEPTAKVAAITAAVRAYAERTGAVIVAEGVETEAHEQLARVFGATYAQGRRYGAPGPLPHILPVPDHAIPFRSLVTPLGSGSPFETVSAILDAQQATMPLLKHISRYLEQQSEHYADASVLLASFQGERAFVVVANCLEFYAGPTYRTEPVVASPPTDEWTVIVMNPHYAGALVARQCPGAADDTSRSFDYVYTQDREAVVKAARAFLSCLALQTASA